MGRRSAKGRSYGGTVHGSFARAVCEFFDRNRDDTLLLEDALTKYGHLLLTSYRYASYRHGAVAGRELDKLYRDGWLEVQHLPGESGPLYSAGPLLLALPELAT